MSFGRIGGWTTEFLSHRESLYYRVQTSTKTNKLLNRKLTGKDGFDAEIPHQPAADLVHLQERLRPIKQVVRREEHLNDRQHRQTPFKIIRKEKEKSHKAQHSTAQHAGQATNTNTA